MANLSDIAAGSYVKVKKIHGSGAIRRRIMDMGITKGTTIFVKKFAPLGDPMEMNLRGYSLSLRKIDAKTIELE